jgi:hypothetical protein
MTAICALKTHRHYRRDWSAFEVRLDGAIVKDFLFADAVRGRVIQMVHDPVSNAIVLNDRADGPKIRELKGRVAIDRTSTPLTDRFTEAALAVLSKSGATIVRPQ